MILIYLLVFEAVTGTLVFGTIYYVLHRNFRREEKEREAMNSNSPTHIPYRKQSNKKQK